MEWARRPFSARAEMFLAVADLLIKRKGEYAKLMAEEMGKPISQGLAEIEKCAKVCKYYVENSERFLSDKHIETEAKKSYVTYNPLGIILGIMPWNFPFWQVFRFAVPTLMAGNAV
ncbi:MAG TPA: aldehyde dehydrogenase family protein, partial [Candidatus Kapabacteria bacterium]|nr:aldehyde dehydrogenase family protein [Candidatus Kapabacteria bacterium]